MGLSNLPENRLAQNETRAGVYYLESDGAAEALEVTVFKDGTISIVGGKVEDKPMRFTQRQVQQLAAVLNTAPAGGPTMRRST